MRHEIRFVHDDDMPKGQDFMLLVSGDLVRLCYRQSAVCVQRDPDRAARVLEDSWAAYRALERELLGV